MRVVVIGAGIIGAHCAWYAARAGCEVVVLDRGRPAGGTSSHGEGNLLVSDKGPGPELDLALRSLDLWREQADELGADALEYEPKGGLAVPTDPTGAQPLAAFADAQRSAGVVADFVEDPRAIEPGLAPDLAGAFHYPQDAQCQPVRATMTVLRAAVAAGARFEAGVSITAGRHDPAGRLTAVIANTGTAYEADAFVNAAGPWAAELGALLGAPIPIMPRRGVILVTEPLPPLVRGKVYSADYVANVESDDAGLQTSAVVEGTQGGTVLIGASRERVGFGTQVPVEVPGRLAAQAIRLFPALATVHLLRSYVGFRPYSPDHLPIIGPDPRVPGLLHATGHEGAGIGLAPGTAEIIAAQLTGAACTPLAQAFRPERFDGRAQ